MSYTHLPMTDDRDRDEHIAMQELRKSGINFTTVDSPDKNPFDSPVEEVEEPLLHSDDEKAPSSKLHPRHPYQRYNSNSSQNRKDGSQQPEIKRRQHSRINLLTPPQSAVPNAPLIICLHGSNDSCMRSWLSLIEVLYKSGFRVLLYDRAPPNPHHGQGADLKPHRAVSELCSYMYSMKLSGPYVFVAHSYGGCVARLFLQQKPREVAGMILVETGQETALAPQVEEEQYRRQILGDAPLSVVRGNTLHLKQDEWVKAAALAKTAAQREQLEPQRLMLEQWEAEDERLKKKQLGLSRRSRFAQVQDVGHHVIRERPDVVAEEVKWVMAEIEGSGGAGAVVGAGPGGAQRPGLGRSISSASAGLKRGLSTRLAGGLQRTFSRKGKA